MQHNKDGEQKSYSLLGRFSLVFVLGFTVLSAGSFEDFKRTQTKSFTKYKDEKDSAFNSYLKEQWQEYLQQNTKSLYEKPKPIEIVPAKVREVKSVGPRIVIPDVKEKKEEKKEKVVVKKEQPSKEEQNKEIVFDFFGSKIGFNIDDNLKRAKFFPQSKKGILNFFNTAASSEYENIILSIKKVSKEMHLNDWGVYQLVTKLSQTIYPNDDDANLFSWFVFNKLGYSVKVALSKKHTVLLFYSKKVIYATPNYSFAKKKYYAVSHYAKGSLGSLYSYEHDYPNAKKALDLSIKKIPNFALDVKSKELKFKDYGQTYKVDFKYNQNLIDFMSTYPQADYKTYFNTPLDEITYSSMLKDLKKYIDGKKAMDAINFILHFVQKSFKYERDLQQFSREKVMFAEETLYFEKSDCEDRAILFSYLVRKILGIGVVGIKYKDHMATALYIPVGGDSIKVAHKRFVIADPTYINANVGQSMRKYKSIRPESFIFLK
jgi:hypothetical protein